MENGRRYDVIDVVKAIGILSIIIGHSAAQLPLTHLKTGPFVYCYHIMVFFFTAGFCYNEKTDTALYCGKRIAGILPLYIGYNTVFVLAHNLLARFSLISAAPYTAGEMLIHFAHGFVMQTDESMLGAFWFLPVFVLASVMFALSFSFARRLFPEAAGKQTAAMAVIMALCAGLGLYLNSKGMYLAYHIQTAFLASPVMFLGWIVRKTYGRLEKLFCRAGYLLAAAALYLGVAVFRIQIELAANLIVSPLLFYPISLLGLYFCLSLGKTILRYRRLTGLMTFIGRRSFHYMALHFTAFKLTDLVIAVLTGNRSPEVLSAFPHAHELGLGYTAVAVLLITLGLFGYEKLRAAFRRHREAPV